MSCGRVGSLSSSRKLRYFGLVREKPWQIPQPALPHNSPTGHAPGLDLTQTLPHPPFFPINLPQSSHCAGLEVSVSRIPVETPRMLDAAKKLFHVADQFSGLCRSFSVAVLPAGAMASSGRTWQQWQWHPCASREVTPQGMTSDVNNPLGSFY